MKPDPSVAREWLWARDVIASYLFTMDDWHSTNQILNRHAENIIARLAAHDPPLLVTTVDVFDQRDRFVALWLSFPSRSCSESEWNAWVVAMHDAVDKCTDKPETR